MDPKGRKKRRTAGSRKKERKREIGVHKRVKGRKRRGRKEERAGGKIGYIRQWIKARSGESKRFSPWLVSAGAPRPNKG